MSSNILEVVENLYDILLDAEVADEDSKTFDSFIDGLRGCIRFRKKTFVITNMVTYLYITIMYIILWLNSSQQLHIDINLYARRKSLESDLTKLLCKSSSNLSANIRDRFGLRGIVLNNEEIACEYIYKIFDAISGILGGKDRKMSKEFIKWFEDNHSIPTIDKDTIRHVLQIPFSIEFVKDFIKNPKENGYRTLQFTMIIQMYSDILPGLPIELQKKCMKMLFLALHLMSNTRAVLEMYLWNKSTQYSLLMIFLNCISTALLAMIAKKTIATEYIFLKILPTVEFPPLWFCKNLSIPQEYFLGDLIYKMDRFFFGTSIWDRFFFATVFYYKKRTGPKCK